MIERRLVLVVVVAALLVVEIRSSSEAMKKITSGFLKVLDECKHELNLSDHILSDLYHFWKEEYALLNRDTGCAIVCMSQKLNILDSTGKLHHGNTKDFALQHGAADDTATKLVDLIHECEKQFESEEDRCVRALEVAKCFRTRIHGLNWAPKMDVIITEVLTDI